MAFPLNFNQKVGRLQNHHIPGFLTHACKCAITHLTLSRLRNCTCLYGICLDALLGITQSVHKLLITAAALIRAQHIAHMAHTCWLLVGDAHTHIHAMLCMLTVTHIYPFVHAVGGLATQQHSIIA